MPRTRGLHTSRSQVDPSEAGPSQPGPSHSRLSTDDVALHTPGPIDSSILWCQSTHRSETIWNGQADNELKINSAKPWILDPRVAYYVTLAGFSGPSMVCGIEIDHALIQTLVERWRRETHTFHFRVGEMTITLEDVAMLLGLRIDGRAVTDNPSLESSIDVPQACDDFLGLRPTGNQCDGNCIKINWLRNNFKTPPPEDADDQTLRRHARAYILCLLGGVLLPTNKANTVPGMYLPLLADFNSTNTYSWGSAVLAHLYSGLCSACMIGATGLAGCALLVQLWSWEHLHVGRPQMANNGLMFGPLGIYWTGSKIFKLSGRTSTRDFYRDELDMQEDCQVVWCPYDVERVEAAFPECSESRALGMSIVPLINFHEVEWHRPNRVLRQFFNAQHIPESIDIEDDALHGQSRRGQSDTVWSRKHACWINLWNARWDRIYEPNPQIIPICRYLKWYNKITRRFILHPRRREQREEQQEQQEQQPAIPHHSGMGYHPRGSQDRNLVNVIADETRLAASQLNQYPEHEYMARMWLQSNERYSKLQADQIYINK